MNEQTKKLILTKVEEGIHLALPDIMNGITHLGEEKELNVSIKLKITKPNDEIEVDGSSSAGMTQKRSYKIPMSVYNPNQPSLFPEENE